jgi:uncharacterized protein YkwD
MYSILKINIFLAIFFLFTGCSVFSTTKPQNSMIEMDSNIDKNIVDLLPYNNLFVNEISNIRKNGTNCGQPTTPLKSNPNLAKAARVHAKDMAINHMVQHEGSGTATDIAKKSEGIGSSFIDRIIFFGYKTKIHNLVGETLAHTKNINIESNDIKEHFKKALDIMTKDPIQCKILMNPRFKDVGIGAYKSKDGYYWAIEYGEGDK